MSCRCAARHFYDEHMRAMVDEGRQRLAGDGDSMVIPLEYHNEQAMRAKRESFISI